MIYEDVRDEIESLVGFELSEDAWAYLEELGLVRDVELDAKRVTELAAEVKRLVRAFSGRDLERRDADGGLLPVGEASAAMGTPARQFALSVLLANEASRDKNVLDFRSDVLKGELLGWDDVEDWVNRQAEDDGPPTVWLTGVPVPTLRRPIPKRPASSGTSPLDIGGGYVARGIGYRVLVCEAGEGSPRMRTRTAVNGVLHWQRSLRESLANRYLWTEAQTSVFVLTGATPLLPLISASTTVRLSSSALARITLTVDPALPVREVADAYRELRGELLAGRFRNISEKHSRLAAFAAERPAGESWHERMTAWNKRHPKWKYSWRSNFARDCARAQQRLLQPAFRLKFVKRRRRTRDADPGRRGKATRRRRTQAR